MKMRGVIRLGIVLSILFFGYQHWVHLQLIETLASDRILKTAEQTCLKQEPTDPQKAADCYGSSQTNIYKIQTHAKNLYWSSGIYDVSLDALIKIAIGWILATLSFLVFRWTQRGFQ